MTAVVLAYGAFLVGLYALAARADARRRSRRRHPSAQPTHVRRIPPP